MSACSIHTVCCNTIGEDLDIPDQERDGQSSIQWFLKEPETAAVRDGSCLRCCVGVGPGCPPWADGPHGPEDEY